MGTTQPSAYRKLGAQVAQILLAGYLVVKQNVDSGADLSNWGVWAAVIVALCGAVGVYAPPSPWAKLVAAGAAAAGQVVIAAVSDNHVSGDEALVIFGQLLAFAATWLVSNEPTEPVRPAG
jgi:hypothetical protein